VLEAVLPETPAEMLQLVLRHKRQGASGRFAACQLMMVAAECMVGAPLLPGHFCGLQGCVPRMQRRHTAHALALTMRGGHALQDYTDAAVRSSARVALQELVMIDPRWAAGAAGAGGAGRGSS
jgi:hypothetical protein